MQGRNRLSRRRFLAAGTAAAASANLYGLHQMPASSPGPKLISAQTIAPYVDPLPIPRVARPDGQRVAPGRTGSRLDYYRIPIHEFYAKVHRDVPPTRFWGYGGSVPGPTIETRSGAGVLVEWPNELPARHFLPIDHNLMGAEAGTPDVRTIVHLHGAKAPPASDGYPEDWYTPGRSVLFHYPNEQEPALLWYHDHAMGINRLNLIAGMFGLFVVRDPAEDALQLPAGAFEIPLVLSDRMIRQDGQLYYPVSQRPEAPWVPEFFGDVHLVNGKILPYLEVAPRRYRFRVLNASNAQFYFLTLENSLAIAQIGTDQGLLPGPVQIPRVTLAPAERADLVIDFAGHAGQQIQLKSGPAALLQFRVSRAEVPDPSSLPSVLRSVPKLLESEAALTRQLTLEEFDNVLDEPVTHLLDGKRWHDPISENPVIGSTEIWSFVNLTDDTHPIHLHMVRFQILDRRSFAVTEYLLTRKIRYLGAAVPPAPEESGWKDTVRATPGAVTRIIVKFEGYAGRYVWHCHILEHEDNEMMRPYEIHPAPASGVTAAAG